jgi:hypothetical protein
MIFLLDGKCLYQTYVNSGSCNGSDRLTSGSDAPTTVTSVVWSSWVCSFPGGQAFHIPEISTAVPVDRLDEEKALVSLNLTGRSESVAARARLTHSTACAGFNIACNGSKVDPSDISANAKRFCFRTDRMNPLILTSWSSNLQASPALLD